MSLFTPTRKTDTDVRSVGSQAICLLVCSPACSDSSCQSKRHCLDRARLVSMQRETIVAALHMAPVCRSRIRSFTHVLANYSVLESTMRGSRAGWCRSPNRNSDAYDQVVGSVGMRMAAKAVGTTAGPTDRLIDRSLLLLAKQRKSLCARLHERRDEWWPIATSHSHHSLTLAHARSR